ncbi:hypothetical protein SDD27957_08940 [Streptococcus dysgalactiae subsp. dysgalactiae ATCC 27957]|nr:hypothetical protein SDD27957_08940 [Streptococcus dysgalactiae subsp. dysgalactiae ATCC 27957]
MDSLSAHRPSAPSGKSDLLPERCFYFARNTPANVRVFISDHKKKRFQFKLEPLLKLSKATKIT